MLEQLEQWKKISSWNLNSTSLVGARQKLIEAFESLSISWLTNDDVDLFIKVADLPFCKSREIVKQSPASMSTVLSEDWVDDAIKYQTVWAHDIVYVAVEDTTSDKKPIPVRFYIEVKFERPKEEILDGLYSEEEGDPKPWFEVIEN